MIPKVIHYCWFGGNPLPTFAQKCIDSWKKYCPDYRIKQWDEGNVDLNSCAYIREAFEEKKWAFITDYVRLDVLFAEGGIYMDTDVEVVASLDLKMRRRFLQESWLVRRGSPLYKNYSTITRAGISVWKTEGSIRRQMYTLLRRSASGMD